MNIIDIDLTDIWVAFVHWNMLIAFSLLFWWKLSSSLNFPFTNPHHRPHRLTSSRSLCCEKNFIKYSLKSFALASFFDEKGETFFYSQCIFSYLRGGKVFWVLRKKHHKFLRNRPHTCWNSKWFLLVLEFRTIVHACLLDMVKMEKFLKETFSLVFLFG